MIETSEFECIQGHQMLPSQGPYCKICGGRVYRMDGLTGSQHRKLEEMQDEEEWLEEEDEG